MKYIPLNDGVLIKFTFKKGGGIILSAEAKETTRQIEKIEVVLCGDDVKKLNIGDRVIMNPVFNSERMVLEENDEFALVIVKQHAIWGITQEDDVVDSK